LIHHSSHVVTGRTQAADKKHVAILICQNAHYSAATTIRSSASRAAA
jgi:hypothetical protein